MSIYLLAANCLALVLAVVLMCGLIWSTWRIHCTSAMCKANTALTISATAILVLTGIVNVILFVNVCVGGPCDDKLYLGPLILSMSSVLFTVSGLRALCEQIDRDKRAQAEGHGNTDRIY